MTTEIEKQFFNTFGIEPKKQCYYWDCPYSTGNIANDIAMNERDCNSCKNPDKEIYPQITDRILLELEDILLKKYIQIEYNYFSGDYYASCSIALCNGRADNKKDAFLQMLISIAQNYLDNSDIDGEELIYKEVRILFEAENE